MKFHYWKAKDGLWRWNLRAKNGEIIASGEGYVHVSDCLVAIELVRGSGRAALVKGYR